MKTLTNLFVSAVELLEAEGRDLRRWALRVGVSISLVLAAAALLTAGVLTIAAGVFLLLRRQLEPGPALLITGVLVLSLAGALLWTAHTLIKPPD